VLASLLKSSSKIEVGQILTRFLGVRPSTNDMKTNAHSALVVLASLLKSSNSFQ